MYILSVSQRTESKANTVSTSYAVEILVELKTRALISSLVFALHWNPYDLRVDSAVFGRCRRGGVQASATYPQLKARRPGSRAA